MGEGQYDSNDLAQSGPHVAVGLCAQEADQELSGLGNEKLSGEAFGRGVQSFELSELSAWNGVWTMKKIMVHDRTVVLCLNRAEALALQHGLFSGYFYHGVAWERICNKLVDALDEVADRSTDRGGMGPVRDEHTRMRKAIG